MLVILSNQTKMAKERGGGSHLARDSIEQRIDHGLGETPFLIFVHDDNLLPIIGNLREMQAPTEIDKVQDVLLEARPPESDRCTQEFRSNA